MEVARRGMRLESHGEDEGARLQRHSKIKQVTVFILFNIQGHMQILEIGAPFGPSCSPSPFLSNETLSSRRRERTHVMHGDRDFYQVFYHLRAGHDGCVVVWYWRRASRHWRERDITFRHGMHQPPWGTAGRYVREAERCDGAR